MNETPTNVVMTDFTAHRRRRRSFASNAFADLKRKSATVDRSKTATPFHLFLSDCPPYPFRDFQWLRSADDAVSVRHGLVIDKSCVHGNRLNSRNSMASRSSRSKCIASAHTENKIQNIPKQKHETLFYSASTDGRTGNSLINAS